MKEKLDSVSWWAYLMALFSGGSIELDDCLILPGWSEDCVYQNDPTKPDGPGKIWRYSSRVNSAIISFRESVVRLLMPTVWLGSEGSVSWGYRLAFLIVVILAVILAEMAVMAGRK